MPDMQTWEGVVDVLGMPGPVYLHLPGDGTEGATGRSTRLLAAEEAGGVVAVLACDSGLKYLSTDLY